MTYAIGQTVTAVVSIRDNSNVPIIDLLEDDFVTLEAFLVTMAATTVPVVLEELITDGQYTFSFIPTTSGPWALHYVYDETPVFHEDTIVYEVVDAAEIVVVTAGGTWTYEGNLTDPAQEVRFLIQDTDGDHPMFTDAEVNYALGAAGGVTRRAASSLVERLMARYAGMADTTELDLSVRASQLYEHAKDLLATLNNTFSGLDVVVPYAGGISHADILTNQQNTDRRSGIFDRTSPFRLRDWGGI